MGFALSVLSLTASGEGFGRRIRSKDGARPGGDVRSHRGAPAHSLVFSLSFSPIDKFYTFSCFSHSLHEVPEESDMVEGRLSASAARRLRRKRAAERSREARPETDTVYKETHNEGQDHMMVQASRLGGHCY